MKNSDIFTHRDPNLGCFLLAIVAVVLLAVVAVLGMSWCLMEVWNLWLVPWTHWGVMPYPVAVFFMVLFGVVFARINWGEGAK